MPRKRTTRDIGKFRSGLEFDFAHDLKQLNVDFQYEPDRIEYRKVHTYTPDFKIANNVYLETKGRMTGSDRTKMILTRDQNPGVIFIMVLQDPNIKLTKKSKTTYAMWCEKNGFEWVKYGDSTGLKLILKKYNNGH